MTIETEQYIKEDNKSVENISARLLNKKKAGHIIGKIMAERKFNKKSVDHYEKIAKMAKQLSFYDKVFYLPDPLNKKRKLNITRLIASI